MSFSINAEAQHVCASLILHQLDVDFCANLQGDCFQFPDNPNDEPTDIKHVVIFSMGCHTLEQADDVFSQEMMKHVPWCVHLQKDTFH